MLKDWYVKLHSGSGPTALSGKLTYDLAPVSYRADSTKACRMFLYYSNPNSDMSVESAWEDPEYAQRTDYELELNPANLDFSGSHSFADQLSRVVAEAEKLINQKQDIYDLEFSVPNTGFGMQDTDPTDDDFTLEATSMGTVADAASPYRFEPILSVNLNKLQADVNTYLAYKKALINQQKTAANKSSVQSATLIDKIENLTPNEMVTEVNSWLKRKKISVSRLLEILIQDANSVNATNVANTFYDLLDKDNWLTKDGELAYRVLDGAFQNAKYDNGKPLSGYNDPENPNEWHDYFEHYDRDQDYESIFDDDRVTRVAYVIGDKTTLNLFFDFTKTQLQAWVEQQYGGSEYAHDFK